MIYLDANVFINASINQENLGNVCRNLLDYSERGEIEASTSALVFDEVLWKLRSFMKYQEAILRVKNMLELPINIIPVDAKIIYDSLFIAENFNLKPRDSIHLSCMKQEEITEICSTDSDFDSIKDIKRIHPEKFKF